MQLYGMLSIDVEKEEQEEAQRRTTQYGDISIVVRECDAAVSNRAGIVPSSRTPREQTKFLFSYSLRYFFPACREGFMKAAVIISSFSPSQLLVLPGCGDTFSVLRGQFPVALPFGVATVLHFFSVWFLISLF